MTEFDENAFIAEFMNASFDPGLHVLEAGIVGMPEHPVLIVHFEDEARRPGERLRAWWDVHEFMEGTEVRDAAWLAGMARAFLHEAFHAAGPIESWPTDEHGSRYVELDWRDTHRPPPV